MLTVKEERFAQLLAMADISQTAAYIEAGYSPTQLRKTLWEEASRLANKPKVIARVDEIRATARDKGVITLERHLKDLDAIGKAAIADGDTAKNYGAAVRCEELRGKAAGLYVDRIRNETPDELSVPEFCTVNGAVVPEAVRLVERAVQILEEVERGGLPHVVKEVG